MTVSELVAILQQLPSHMTVVVDLHSQYNEVTNVRTTTLIDKGGYFSDPFSEEEKLRARECVRIA